MKVLLHEMSWPEAKEYFMKNDVVILPVGSNEQHGPHNPLGTDYLIADFIAKETARRTKVACLQVIPFGISAHHKQFSGTIYVRSKTFSDYVKDVCLALNYYGTVKIVIVNGHGGNRCALMGIARELGEKGILVSIFHWWIVVNKLLPDLFKSEERGHAGAEETSVNLALHPHLVSMDKAVDDTGDYTRPFSGVFGRSTTASTEKGQKIFEAAVNELVGHVNLLKEAKIEDLIQKSKA